MFSLTRAKYIEAMESATNLVWTLCLERANLFNSEQNLSANWYGQFADENLRMFRNLLQRGAYDMSISYANGMVAVMEEYLPEIDKMMAKREKIAEQLEQDWYVEPDLSSFCEEMLILDYDYIEGIKADGEGVVYYGDKAIEILTEMIEEVNACASEYVNLSVVEELLATGKRKLHRIDNFIYEFVDFARKMSDMEYNICHDLSTKMNEKSGVDIWDQSTQIPDVKVSTYIEIPYSAYDAELDRWINTTHGVAQAYLENVTTYCTRTISDAGYGSTDAGRKMYLLKGIDGNLDGYKVGDDCSSFVYACLIQAGYIPKEKIKTWPPVSSHYLPTGEMEEILINAGFVWYGRDELKAEDIQKGDILVKNGHVEIFDKFENGVEYAYTWGAIYETEPAPKRTTINNIWKNYEGVWRYEGN